MTPYECWMVCQCSNAKCLPVDPLHKYVSKSFVALEPRSPFNPGSETCCFGDTKVLSFMICF